MKIIFLVIIAVLATAAVNASEDEGVGRVLQMEGCGGVSISSDRLMDLTDSFTISLFVRTRQNGAWQRDSSIVEKWSGTHENRTGFPIAIRLYPESGRVGALVYDGHHENPMATSWTKINDGNWHNIAVVRHRQTETSKYGLLQLYVDGHLQGEVSSFLLAPETTINDSPFTLGRRFSVPNSCFNGEIFQFRVWDRPLGGGGVRAVAEIGPVATEWREGLLAEINDDFVDVSGFDDVKVQKMEGGEDKVSLQRIKEWPQLPSSPPPSSDVNVFPVSKNQRASTIEENLQHYILGENLHRNFIEGHLFVLDNPHEFLSILPPAGGCPHLATVGQTAREVDGGCAVATNAGLFNTHSGSCHGNLVSDATVHQFSGSQNANFGITEDGNFVSGFISAEDLENNAFSPFQQLIAGMVWLVRNGTNVVSRYSHEEDFSRQETGSGDDFIRVFAPRLAIGHDKDGKLIILQMDGDEGHRIGVDLQDMARLMIKYGAINAVNLDGGSSDVVYFGKNIVNTPMHNCNEEGLGKWGRCEREVATILCVRNKPRTTVEANATRDQAHGTGLKFLFFIAVATLLVVCVALTLFSGSNNSDSTSLYEYRPQLLAEQELKEVDHDEEQQYQRRELRQNNGMPQAL